MNLGRRDAVGENLQYMQNPELRELIQGLQTLAQVYEHKLAQAEAQIA